MSTNDSVSILNDLIAIVKDSEQGFRLASENITDSHLKQILAEKAESCKSSAEELQECVKEMNGDPQKSGSLLGALHRGWVNMRSAISENNAYAILAECERGEDVAKAAYAKVLEEDLPPDIHQLIQDQYEGVIRDHNLVRDLRDQYAD